MVLVNYALQACGTITDIEERTVLKRIDYADIMGVRNGRKAWGLSFAFSLDCLQIDVSGFPLGYRISPKERQGFLLALGNRCDHLVLVDQELMLRK